MLGQLALQAQQAIDGFKDVDRDADGAGLVGNRAADGLADPPGGVSAELIAARRVELGHGPQQPQVALLDQVQERAAAPQVTLGHADHQAQVRADEHLAGILGALLHQAQFPLQSFFLLQVAGKAGGRGQPAALR